MISAALEISIKCPKCDHPVPLDGPVESAHCPSCQQDAAISPEYWKDIFKSILEDMNELKEGEGRNSTIFGEFNTTLLYGRQQPRCGKCKTTFQLPSDLSKEAELVCAKCGEKSLLFPTPEKLRQAGTKAKAFVGAALKGAPPTDAGTASKPVIFLCPQCGGSLHIDGKDRMVNCTFCKADIYLPDDLWLRLHPAKVKGRWYTVFA